VNANVVSSSNILFPGRRGKEKESAENKLFISTCHFNFPLMATFLLFVLFLLAPLILLFLYGAYYRLLYYKCLDLMPGPPIISLFEGNVPEVRKSLYLSQKQDQTGESPILKTLRKWFILYGPIYRVWAVHKAFVIFNGASVIKEIMKKDIPKGDIYTFLHPWLGVSLLTSNGCIWKRKRKLLGPAFHFSVLQHYVDIFNNCTLIMVSKWKNSARENSSINVFRQFTALTLDTVGLCAFNYHIHAQENDSSPYVQAVYAASELVFARIFTPIYTIPWIYSLSPQGRKFRKILKIIHDMPNNVIKKRREEMAQQPQKANEYKDFLSILLNVGSDAEVSLTDKEIRAEVDTFMFEGHDTTAAALTWVTYLLAKHPKVQHNVQNEIDKVLGNRDFPAYSDLDKFRYLTMVIKETLRLYPSVPFLERVTEKEIVVAGYNIPAKTELFIIPYVIHRNPEDWGNEPDEFIPERFLPENCAKRDPFAFIPFAAGNRNCIGQNFAMMEIKTVLSILFKKFSVEMVLDHPVIPETHLILRPKFGVKVKVKERFPSQAPIRE